MTGIKAVIAMAFYCSGIKVAVGTEVRVLHRVGHTLYSVELPSGVTCRIGKSRLQFKGVAK